MAENTRKFAREPMAWRVNPTLISGILHYICLSGAPSHSATPEASGFEINMIARSRLLIIQGL
ncbi:MAG: hypothetical protein M1294_05960, partial [Firmicutes bacterium]|nr:hypothetical protein [Bacillota bacterium]